MIFESAGPAVWQASPEARRTTLALVAEVASRFPDVRLVYGFGSFVGRGPFRDIDLGVVFGRAPGWQTPASIALEIGLAIGPGPEVDVVVLNDADTLFKEHIAEHGTLAFEPTPGEAAEFTAMARSEAIDLREWRRTRALEGDLVRSERRIALRNAIEDLRRYRVTFGLPQFLGDRDAQRLVLHALYVATQASIDEAQQRVSEWGLENRGTYRDAFIVLAQAGRLPPELGGQMALWATMRNVLAHFYPVLDLRRVHAALADVEQIAAFESWLLATDGAPEASAT